MQQAIQTPMQRSRGAAFVALRQVNGRTRLADLGQSGSAKAILPAAPGRPTEVVFLNTSGGLTGGDRLSYRAELGPATTAVVTTQTAERCYATLDGVAEVEVRLQLGMGAQAQWLPQETILFNGAAVNRRTEIDLAAGASCLACESIVLGRAAMGEAVNRLSLRDHRIIRRQGRPVWADTLHLTDGVLGEAGGAAVLAGARAFAVLVLVAQGAEDAVTQARACLDPDLCTGAATGWDGRCVVRLSARDNWPLRRQLERLVRALGGGMLPRVWQSGEQA